MADKEATVYIIDVAKSMGKHRHGRTISNLEWVMEYVWDRITKTVRSHFKGCPLFILANSSCKVATGRKTATVGVVGLRTDGRGI
jgi:ATP-dependent DNA helicase 2 subunit 2